MPKKWELRCQKSSYVAHGEDLRLDEVSIEVVESDDTVAGGASDHAQRLLDSFPVQLHCYTLPQEEARLAQLETCIHQLLRLV